ncbi:polysaccharide pyruvyl transferase family protein [Methylobacterium sp. E-045]|uniref:polysaccharide pyruvyl transferase family protein n=1 Tax=Methylobacterium sp. E-045 TaxID=2836575 RepID=UPI001FBB2F8E|nr:polysaccharide pyruvyl transferase family protein [Methylobacterium sp. E-045]MCJ2131552.1 polysaccharide pyruvyl transferase family protein [Methylobacterium sp. E-045]
MATSITRYVREKGEIPLAWAGSTLDMNYLNFGDALSPVMIALLSGKPIRRAPMKSFAPRLSCVGTIGHGFANGEVWFWGTGCSNWANPSAPAAEKKPFVPSAESHFTVTATRGPVSESLLSAKTLSHAVPYGDPVWLLPRFYKPTVKKRYKLGVILHLSELANREMEAVPRKEIARFRIPAELADDIHLITTVTELHVGALQSKIDEILSCERIVSTSLHGMVIAESYGIPCLYFAPSLSKDGLQSVELTPGGDVDLRIVDLYTGLGLPKIDVYNQPRPKPSDWPAIMKAIDQSWSPKSFDGDALINAFPVDLSPISAAPGETIWEHKALTDLKLRHDVGELNRLDRKEFPGGAKAAAARFPDESPKGASKAAARAVADKTVSEPSGEDAALAAGAKLEKKKSSVALLKRIKSTLPPGSVPLAWAASSQKFPYANFGDALSAVMVAAISGRVVRHAAFDSKSERLVAVGTIGHAISNGTVHMWGTGLDAQRCPGSPNPAPYQRPAGTDFHVHAVRGPKTGAVLRAQGIAVPEIYGDPVYLLPKFWPMDHVAKTHEIGVIVHLTELASQDPAATVLDVMTRYGIPPERKGDIRIINTITERDAPSLRAKVEEIVSCRHILSTSLHGLVIAECYGIPSAWFATYGQGEGRELKLDDDEEKVDHRVRDFYLGAGVTRLNAFCLERRAKPEWDKALDWIKATWRPLTYSPQALFEAFPLPKAVEFEATPWPVEPKVLKALKF